MVRDNDNSDRPFLHHTISQKGQKQKGKDNDVIQIRCACCRCFCCHIPLFCCLLVIIGFFLFFLIFALFIANYFMMKKIYDAINNNYFSKEIIDPIIDRNANFTQAFNVRIKALDELLLESKLYNMQYAIEFLEKNEITLSDSDIESKINFGIKNEAGDVIGNKTIVNSNYSTNFTQPIGTQDVKCNVQLCLLNFYSLFHSNLLSPYRITELAVYINNTNSDSLQYITYCEDIDNQQGFLKSIMNSTKEHATYQNLEDGFYDFLSKNEYEQETGLNYLKFYQFTSEKNSVKYLVILRMRNETINNLYNKQEGNVTIVFPVTDLTTNTSDIIIYPGSQFLSNFFLYGTKNEEDSKSQSLITKYHSNLTFINLEVKTFFNLLYYIDPNAKNEINRYHYNPEWRKEYILLGQIIYNESDFLIDNRIDLLPNELDCSSRKSPDIKNNNIMCHVIKQLHYYPFEMSSYGIDLDLDEIDSQEWKDFYESSEKSSDYYLQSKYDEAKIQLNNSIFTNNVETKTPTKLLIYHQKANNLLGVNIELMDSLLYSSIKEDFISSMDHVKKISNIILIIFCIVAFVASMVFLGFEINKTTIRVKTISKLKNLLFYKKEINNVEGDTANFKDLFIGQGEDDDDDDEREDNITDVVQFDAEDNIGYNKADNYCIEQDKEDINLQVKKDNSIDMNNKMEEEYDFSDNSDKILENEIDFWDKKNIYKSNFFENGNRLIVKFTYDHLVLAMNRIDNYADKKFTEKLRFLRRKYKLNKEHEGKKDCQLASDIYQAVSKIDMLNLKDVSYNVHYDPGSALNHSFRMFRSILNNAENKKFIPIKNNKFINFDDIFKIVYFIKKEKIQLLVNNIFEKEYKDTKREQYIDTGYPTRKNGSNENFILSLRNKKSSSPNHSNGIYDEKGHFIKKGILKNQS